MLLRWIEQTRKKPRVVREQYAFLGAVFITGIIAGVWALTLPNRFDTVASEESGARQSASAFAQFFSEAKENLSGVIDGGESVEPAEPEVETKAIVIPQLSEDTTESAKKNEPEKKARPILIATTSSDQLATSTQGQ